MALYKNKYRVESNRLKNWDYSGNGIYFLTICCRNRECHLGEVIDGEMVINEKGKIVYNEIINSVKIRTKWVFHNWIIMPNHLHLLIEIKESLPKFNFSTKRIIQNATDVEIINAFLNFPESIFHQETHSGASQQEVKNINEETHRSASPQGNNNLYEETHRSASPQRNNNIYEETHRIASPQGNNNIYEEAHRSATQQGNNNIYAETHLSAPPQGNNNINEETHRSASPQEINDKMQRELMEKFKRKPKSISSFVAQLKSKISKQINELENTKDSIWQSNYHDSIITSPEMFKNVYFYILNNPKNWEKDSLKQ